MEQRIEEKRIEIVKELKILRRRLESDDNSQLLVWIIPGALACAHPPRHHPLYGGSGLPIPSAATPLVLDWIRQIQEQGTKSIVSFMHDRDLRCYAQMDLDGLDLTGFLAKVGFSIKRLPWEDPAHSRTDARLKRAQLERMRQIALEAFDELPKPVLIQCSAAIDRSAPVAAYIWQHRSNQA